MIEFIYKEPTLIETIKAMERWNKKGYSTWIEGKGNGMIRVVIEDNKLTIGGKYDKSRTIN